MARRRGPHTEPGASMRGQRGLMRGSGGAYAGPGGSCGAGALSDQPGKGIRAASACVLLVDGLAGDAEHVGDLLPGPALAAGIVNLEGLELLKQPA